LAILNFDATQVAPDQGQLDPIPAAWYNVAFDESDLAPTKDGTGTILKMSCRVLDGQFVGRKLYTNFNIRNSSAQAQEIAYKQLSALAHAVNVLNVQDSSQLHAIPLKVRVKLVAEVKDADGSVKYPAKNEITAYRNVNEAVPTGGPAQAATSQSNPFGAPAGMPPVNSGMPPVPQAAPVQPQAQQPWQQAPQQPWQQPAQAAPVQPAIPMPQTAPLQQAPMQQAPVQQQQPAWAQASPQPEPVPVAATQEVPPWMRPVQ